MKVIFDSNVWQIVAIPSDFPSDPAILGFQKIHQAIIDKKIEPFLSETVFTIEAIKKVERQDFFSSTEAKITTQENTTDDGYINMEFTIGPNEKDAIDFTDRPILKKYFDAAIDLGFNIARLPRIGGLVNNEIEEVRYKMEGESLSGYLDKVFEVVQKIENSGAGMAQLEAIGKQYDSKNWFKGLKKTPETDRKKIAKAAAEWADGDSVAISIALNCDYFCTRDKASGAGSTSVLSGANLAWLGTDYGFKTILPEDLAKLI